MPPSLPPEAPLGGFFYVSKMRQFVGLQDCVLGTKLKKTQSCSGGHPLKTPVKNLHMETIKKEPRLKRKIYMRDYWRKYNQRKKYIKCSLENSQYQSLEQYAKKAGMKPATFLRAAAFAYMNQRQLLPKSVTDRLPSLISFIRNIANNLNQIARHTNTFKKTTIYDLLKARNNVLAFEDKILSFINASLKDGNKINESEKKA